MDAGAADGRPVAGGLLVSFCASAEKLVPSSQSVVAGPGLVGRAFRLRIRRRFPVDISPKRVIAGRWRSDG